MNILTSQEYPLLGLRIYINPTLSWHILYQMQPVKTNKQQITSVDEAPNI